MPTPTLAPDAISLAAYEATAPLYDAFTAHHRHGLWTDMLERLLRPHGLRERGRLLDVGCGTGKSFVPWEERGWSVVACDASPAMLERASRRAGPGTATVLADARDLGALGRFDLVAMCDDVVNYLAPHEHVPAFSGVARNLAPDGLFAFDVNTLKVFRTFFADTIACEAGDRFAVWRGAAPRDLPPGGVAEATLDGFVEEDDGSWSRLHAVHRQYHHPVDLLRTTLAEAGLRVVAVHGVDADCRHDERVDELRHDKVVVVARQA